MQWMDEWTEAQIGFEKVRKALHPLSVYGQLHTLARLPFGRGDEVTWQADHEDVLRLFNGVGQRLGHATILSNLIAELSELPDVRSVPELLRHGASLQMEQVVALKRFTVQVLTVDRALAQGKMLFSWWEIIGMAEIARQFSADTGELSRDFSLKDVKDAGYDQALHEYQQTRAQRMNAERRFLQVVGQDYRVTLRRDQTLVFALDDQAKVAQAKRDERLRLRLQTPFDVVFDPIWPSEVHTFQSKEQMDAEQLGQQEARLLAILSELVRPYARHLDVAIASVGRLDELLARVQMARTGEYAWSTLGTMVQVEAGRQPDMPEWVPVDVNLRASVALLTGPNMGGKTAAQKTWLLLQACHQMGYPVPAIAFAAPLFQALRYVGGDAQSLTSGLSSFGAEMVKCKEALEIDGGFICFDEIGRHTNPAEGQAIITALIEALQSKQDGQYVLATHYSLPDQEGVQYLRVAGIREDAITMEGTSQLSPDAWIERLNAVMDYHIIEVDSGEVPRQGLMIAKWLGLPESLLARAANLLDEKAKR